MIRGAGILLAGLLLACVSAATAADVPLAGTWKVVLPMTKGGTRAWWLVKFENKDNKWAAAIQATGRGVPEATIEGVSATAEAIRFTLKIPSQGVFQFNAKTPKETTPKILGEFSKGSNILAAELERTTLTGLDDYDLNKETLATKTGGAEVMLAALGLLNQAAEKKAKAEEVRGWADKAVKAAEAYGPLWHREIVLSVAEILVEQEGYAPVALRYAQQAETLVGARERPALRKRALQLLAMALEKNGKAEDAKEVLARLTRIDFKIKPEAFAGRKGKSDRAVLVELFTGAQCPPCVAADLAFDALGKTYKPSEVILLQYHLHVPGPDPLANPDTIARASQKFYGEAIEGTPAIFFSGRPGVPSGGDTDAGPEKYEEYRGAIDLLLEEPAKAKLKATAVQKGNKITIKAEVSDLAETGNNVRLRLALTEEEIAYTGANKLPSHHNVVRALPGGVEGVALKDKTGKQEVVVDLDQVRKTLKDYLTKFAETNKFPGKEPTIDLKKLSVVAFVQNDETGEVLQAVRAEVKTE
jgi:hypothetical protein